VRKTKISFNNGNHAIVITSPCSTSAQEVLRALDLPSPSGLIVIFGGAAGLDDSLKAGLGALFFEAVAPVAAELRALIIDGGTQSGVMAMTGEAVARCPQRCELLGIAPAGKVTYPGDGGIATADRAPLEPNHSHFILVDSNEWGGETETMFEIARAFETPVVAMLVNGGALAAKEVLQSVRNGWQILVVEGSGRFADELSAAVRNGQFAKSVEVSEITHSGRVALFHADDPAEKLRDELRRRILHG
jgi:hypothetical protein